MTASDLHRNSIRSLQLPPHVLGKPEEVCREVLNPLFALAVEGYVICQGLEPQHLAQLTIGFASFLREECKLTVVVVVEEEMASASYFEAFRQKWLDILQVKAAAHRLAIYRFFADTQQLRICVRSSGDFGTRSPVPGRLLEGCGIVLIADEAHTGVEILWREIPKLGQQTEVAADLKWSFGDPSRHVLNMSVNVQQVVSSNPSGRAHQIETGLKDLIRGLPPVTLPWEETFGQIDTPGVRLYPHQEKAIDAWIHNEYRGIFKMCTGAGKTVSSLAAIWRRVKIALERGERVPPVIVTVPTRVLADQWCQEIRKLGFNSPVQAYNSKIQWHPTLEACLECPQEDTASFVVSTYRTFAEPAFQKVLERQQKRGQKAIWIADEMHNLASSRLMVLAKEREGYFSARLGLSATPEIENEPDRTERLMNYFGGIVGEPYELKDGIRDGVLCSYRYFPYPCYLNPDLGRKYFELLQKIDSAESGGKTDIDLYREKRDLVRKSGIQVQAFTELLPGLLKPGRRFSHTLVYCPPGYGSVMDMRPAEDTDILEEESDEVRLLNEVRSTLRARHVEVACILGETRERERNSTLQEFAAGRIQAVCAIGCLDEGVDIPSIERAIVLSSVNRKKQFIQRRGRILRRSQKDSAKVAEIYDVIVLPHGSQLPVSQAERLLQVELSRYQEFAQLALNRKDADNTIREALVFASSVEDGTI